MVPHYQPIPLPAPFWFLESFLVLGFFLHLIPMNIVLGGSFSSALLILFSTQESYTRRFAIELAKALPIFLSFAITQGIVPLLFLQLLYGPLYYTSSIIMALPWLSVIFILLAAYYLLYFFKFNNDDLSKHNSCAWILLFAACLFLIIGFIFSNNMTLMLHPEKWTSMIDISSSGLHMNHSEEQLIPRFSLMICNAFAVVGILMGCYGLYYHSRDQEYSNWLIKYGSLLYLCATLTEIIPTYFFAKILPQDLLQKFLGASQVHFAVILVIMLCSLIAIVMSVLNFVKANRFVFITALSSTLIANLAFAISRHLIRIHFTNQFVQPNLIQLNIQWDILIVFLILFVAMFVYLLWLITIVFKAYKRKVNL